MNMKKYTNKTTQYPQHTTGFGIVQYLLHLLRQYQANQYIEAEMARNQTFFPSLSGIRVRLPNSGSSRGKDYILPWDSSDTISLEKLGFPGWGEITRQGSRAFLSTNGAAYELTLDQPVVIRHDNPGGKPIQDAVITWIGG
jgi:hypothetical protein